MTRLVSILYMCLLGISMTVHAAPLCQAQQDSTQQRQQADKKKKKIKRESTLDTLMVSGSNITHYADRDVIRITRAMRKGAYNTAELLGRIPGMDWNRGTEALKYRGSNKILILVDSLEKDASYVKGLYHLRYDKIDVIYNPHGRYEGYDVLINLHTKPDYEGYESNFGELTKVLPTNAYDGIHLTEQEASADYTYTKNKWNLVGRYFFNFQQNGFSNIDETSVYHANQLQERTVDPKYRRSHTRMHWLNLSADYQINADHSLSFLYRCTPGSEDYRRQESVERTWLETGMVDTVFKDYKSCDHKITHTIGAFYRGRVKGWGFTYDFNYRRNQNQPDMAMDRSSGFAYDYRYDNTMDYVWTKSEVNRKFLDSKFYVSLGHNYTWKSYHQKDRVTDDLLSRNTNTRHDVYTYASYNFTDNTQLSLGVSVDHSRMESRVGKTRNLDLRLTGMFYQRLFKKAYFRARYNYSSFYPSLGYVTEHGQYTDSLKWSVGNPLLKVDLTQSGSISLDVYDFSLWCDFIVAPNLKEYETSLGDVPDGKCAITSPMNVRYNDWNAGLSYRKNIKAFRVSAAVSYKKQRFRWNGTSSSNEGFNGYASVSYSHDKSGFGAGLTYNNYQSRKAKVQGKATEDLDYFSLYVSQRLFKKRMSVGINWNMPMTFSSAKKTTWSSSDALYYCQTQHTANTYNTIELRLSYRIMGGKSVRHYSRTVKGEN